MQERVAALLQGAPSAQSAVKGLVRTVAAHPEAAREATAEIIAAQRASDEGREGMTAFLDKRDPAWRVSDK